MAIVHHRDGGVARVRADVYRSGKKRGDNEKVSMARRRRYRRSSSRKAYLKTSLGENHRRATYHHYQS